VFAGSNSAAFRFAGRYSGNVHARVDWLLRAACAEFCQAMLRIGNQVQSACNFTLRPAPQFQIARIEARECEVQVRAPGMLEPPLTIRRGSAYWTTDVLRHVVKP